MIKHCNSCGISKDITEFYVCKNAKDGKQSCCKDCSKASRKKQNKNTVYLTPEEKKAKKQLSDRNWKKNNPHKAKINNAKYYTRLYQAMPTWLTSEQLRDIEEIYRNCPSGYHVDHIVPLKGKNVSGLHVSWNLQYLLAADNMKKGNKFDVMGLNLII